MTKIIDMAPNYSISTEGVVTNIQNGYIKKCTIYKNGYRHADMCVDGKIIKVSVHRLVGLAFIPNPENKRVINHKDGNKLNNNIDNLEWATDSENLQHAYNTGLKPKVRRVTDDDLKDIFALFLTGVSLTVIAEDLPINVPNLSTILKEYCNKNNLVQEFKDEAKRQKWLRAAKTGKERRKKYILYMLDKNTEEVLKTFDSYSSINEYFNKAISGNVCNVIKGRAKTANGYKWKLKQLKENE